MFYVTYLAAELRRRPARTVLTALGLAVGVALVIIIGALSRGLDDAQDEVLKPLTGVGTELSVSRPIVVPGDDDSRGRGLGDPFTRLPPRERRQLLRETRTTRPPLPSPSSGTQESLSRGNRYSRAS